MSVAGKGSQTRPHPQAHGAHMELSVPLLLHQHWCLNSLSFCQSVKRGKKGKRQEVGGLIRSNLIVHARLFFLIELAHCFHFWLWGTTTRYLGVGDEPDWARLFSLYLLVVVLLYAQFYRQRSLQGYEGYRLDPRLCVLQCTKTMNPIYPLQLD